MMTNLQVTTWNILAPYFMDCKDYPTQSCASLQIGVRRPKIMATLRRLHSDLYLLQEVTQREFEALYDRFHRQYDMHIIYHAKNLWRMKGREWQANGNVLMLKRSKGRVLQVEALSLGKHGNRALMAMIQASERPTERLTERPTKRPAERPTERLTEKAKPFMAISLHLDDVSLVERRRELKDVFRAVERYKLPTIIGGDFNEESAKFYLDLQNFQHSKLRPTYFEAAKIDRIYVYGFKTLQDVKIIDNENTIEKCGSDHSPVSVVVE